MKYLNRKQATQYLREKGLPMGDGYLAQLTIAGKGPVFRRSGQFAIYTEKDLDAWFEARLSQPIRPIKTSRPGRSRGRSKKHQDAGAAA